MSPSCERRTSGPQRLTPNKHHAHNARPLLEDRRAHLLMRVSPTHSPHQAARCVCTLGIRRALPAVASTEVLCVDEANDRLVSAWPRPRHYRSGKTKGMKCCVRRWCLIKELNYHQTHPQQQRIASRKLYFCNVALHKGHTLTHMATSFSKLKAI